VKIAILNWRDLKHPEAGGAEVFVHEVGRRWAEQGHDVTLYSSRWKGCDDGDRDEDLAIRRVGTLRNGQHHLKAPHLLRNVSRPDVLLESINTFPYFLPLRRKPPPYVSLVHQMARDVWRAHLPVMPARFAEWVEPRFFVPYRSRPLLAVSNSTKKDLERAGANDVSVVPQGGIGPQRLREKFADPTVVWVGRLTSNKRPDHAIEAFRALKGVLPDARMEIVGEGPLEATLRETLPPGARLRGRLPREELDDLIGRSHLILMTSIREGWGLVVSEANALGTPAVGYDVPGLTDSILHKQTGLLSAPNPRALAETALSLLKRPGEYKGLSENAAAHGAAQTWDVTADHLLNRLLLTMSKAQTIRAA
jgi:glycosyltransferase involved in cell wall biosynthesis